MVRTYKMKGQKRKKRGERYDRDPAEEQQQQEQENLNPPPPEPAVPDPEPETEEEPTKKAKLEQDLDEMPGIPILQGDNDDGDAPSDSRPGVIFVIEKASLEIAKVGKNYQLLSSDEHTQYLKKHNRDPAQYRPDIAFQAIQTILDSRVNKSGRLKALYVRTEQGILFQIKPHARMPRTYKRFAGLMVQLLQKLHITASGNGEKLLRVIKNPVTQYLPVNARKIGFSHSSTKLVDMYDYVAATKNDADLVFVVGAMSHGKIDVDYVEDYLSISEFPLSAVYAISIITTAVERKWRIL